MSEGLAGILRQLVRELAAIPGVEHALVTSRDGLLVASDATGAEAHGMEMEAAIAAAMFGALDRASSSIELGTVRAALVETPGRSLQMMSMSDVLLIAISAKGTNLAQVRTRMAQGAEMVGRSR